MVELINKAWGWTGAIATDVFSVNSFGNIIFKSDAGMYWHLCPEELSCRLIASDRSELMR